MDYSEKHYISDWGIKLLFFTSMFTVFAITVYATASEFQAGRPTTELVITTIIVVVMEVAVYLLVFRSPLKIRVDHMGVHYKYTPFIWKEKLLSYAEIESWKMRKISPFGEFNGWGYRKKFRNKHTGLVLKDGLGFEFQKTNGTVLVMTSANAEMMTVLLRKYAEEKEVK